MLQLKFKDCLEAAFFLPWGGHQYFSLQAFEGLDEAHLHYGVFLKVY